MQNNEKAVYKIPLCRLIMRIVIIIMQMQCILFDDNYIVAYSEHNYLCANIKKKRIFNYN